jgi:hypothetical protein
MKSDELVAMWTEDSRIDYDYEKGIRDIPKLHAKYINIYLEERKKQIVLEKKLKQLKKEMHDFLTNPLSRKHEKGWELPAQGALIKSEADRVIEVDEDIAKEELKLFFQNEIVDALKRILRQIETRNFLFRDLIEERKYKSGL